MLTAKETRDSFKNFFESKGHQIVPSAPMVKRRSYPDVYKRRDESV